MNRVVKFERTRKPKMSWDQVDNQYKVKQQQREVRDNRKNHHRHKEEA